MPTLVECVPNFSEGRDRAVIDALSQAIAGVSGVKLLDVDPGADTNRTVYTFVGEPHAVADAAFRAAARAVDLIDMSQHKGAHPRIGSMDVCPFVPVSGITMEDCAQLARSLGARIGQELGVPVYFYEHAAVHDARRSLASIRAGEYEGLQARLADPVWRPDAGPAVFHARAGAFVVGAREFLIAYNVNLNTTDRRLAHDIALTIRETGRFRRDDAGQPVVDAAGRQERVAGRLPAVRAIGWYIDQYRQAQVSVNLLRYRTTPLHVVFETVREEAEVRGLLVTGSELVGLTPLEPMLEAGRYFLRKQGKSDALPEARLIDLAVRSLGLDQLAPFDREKKIIEFHFRAPQPLARLALHEFADELSTESPAPGGGSAAALAGTLAAALTAMVGNLTVGKRGHEQSWAAARDAARRAQEVKERLLAAVDADAAAFNALMDAMRLPKGTPEQDAARTEALNRAAVRAAEVPAETARSGADAAELAALIARIGPRASASDAWSAATLARAATEAAALNVLTNLGTIGDPAIREALARGAAESVDRAHRATSETLARANETLPVRAAWLP
jgi:glutamate formiminotransferase/formiminotetrahydrofolate cyclodeaminase